MDIPFSPTVPTRLYALLLKLRPLEYGTLMAFSGEFVHAAWLNWLGSAAPDVATWLHEGNKRRLFTCSSLQFPLPQDKMLEIERRNVHWPLSPEKTYTIRMTLLLGELFPLFHKALTDFSQTGRTSGGRPPFMRLGKQSLLLEEVVLENDEATGWTGFTSFTDIVDAVRKRKLGNAAPLQLQCAPPTPELRLFLPGETLERTGPARTGGSRAETGHRTIHPGRRRDHR